MIEIPGYALTAVIAKRNGHIDDKPTRPVELTVREHEHLLVLLGTPHEGLSRSIRHKLLGAPRARIRAQGWWSRFLDWLVGPPVASHA